MGDVKILFRGVSLFVRHEDRIEVLLPKTAYPREHYPNIAFWDVNGQLWHRQLTNGVVVKFESGSGCPEFKKTKETIDLRCVAGLSLKEDLTDVLSAKIILKGGKIKPTKPSKHTKWRFGAAEHDNLAYELTWDSDEPRLDVRFDGLEDTTFPSILQAADTVMIGNRPDDDLRKWHPHYDVYHGMPCDEEQTVVDHDFAWIYDFFLNVPRDRPLPKAPCTAGETGSEARVPVGAGSPTCFHGMW